MHVSKSVRKFFPAVFFVIVLAVYILFQLFMDLNRKNYKYKVPEKDPSLRTIKVACEDDLYPYSFKSEDGIYQGFNVELIYEIGKKIGVNIEIVDIPQNKVFEEFHNGNIDALLGVVFTPERKRLMEYSDPVSKVPVALFGNKDDEVRVFSSADKIIALKTDDSSAEAIVSLSHLMNVKYYDYIIIHHQL